LGHVTHLNNSRHTGTNQEHPRFDFESHHIHERVTPHREKKSAYNPEWNEVLELAVDKIESHNSYKRVTSTRSGMSFTT